MREWWRSKSPEHRRRLIDGRDPESVREQGRKKMERRRKYGTPQQKAKIAAHNAVKLAKERGDLIPKPCEQCGDEPTHAHHDDYSKPLDVRWLCPQCHRAEHGQERQVA
jgi:ribosomal protein S27AE